jgi:hypothetical protein
MPALTLLAGCEPLPQEQTADQESHLEADTLLREAPGAAAAGEEIQRRVIRMVPGVADDLIFPKGPVCIVIHVVVPGFTNHEIPADLRV